MRVKEDGDKVGEVKSDGTFDDVPFYGILHTFLHSTVGDSYVTFCLFLTFSVEYIVGEVVPRWERRS